MACAAWQNFKDKRQPDGAQPDLTVSLRVVPVMRNDAGNQCTSNLPTLR